MWDMLVDLMSYAVPVHSRLEDLMFHFASVNGAAGPPLQWSPFGGEVSTSLPGTHCKAPPSSGFGHQIPGMEQGLNEV